MNALMNVWRSRKLKPRIWANGKTHISVRQSQLQSEMFHDCPYCISCASQRSKSNYGPAPLQAQFSMFKQILQQFAQVKVNDLVVVKRQACSPSTTRVRFRLSEFQKFLIQNSGTVSWKFQLPIPTLHISMLRHCTEKRNFFILIDNALNF